MTLVNRPTLPIMGSQKHFSTANNHSSRKQADFSASWRSVDSSNNSTNTNNNIPSEHDCEPPTTTTSDGNDMVQPPHPLEYLLGLDAVPAFAAHKHALLNACHLQEGDHILDIGCGTATHVPQYAQQVGPSGRVTAIDYSSDMIQRAVQQQQQHAATNNNTNNNNVQFQVANVYQLPYPSSHFDVVKEDRVLVHLQRPLEALQEMARVAQPGGVVVAGNPDFRSFQIDTFQQRWNDPRRPTMAPFHFDLAELTRRLLNGVIPTLVLHTDMGLTLPRLFHAAGLTQIQLDIVPIPLVGRTNLEAIVPITYMAHYAAHQGRTITPEERDLWLQRLEWEGHDNITGILNMYVCRGVKPVVSSGEYRNRPSIGTTFFADTPQATPSSPDVHIRFARPTEGATRIQQLTDLINSAYNLSDTGITLSSTRVQFHHVEEMVQRGEILMALRDKRTIDYNNDDTNDDVNDIEDESDLLGCVQVEIKSKTTANNNNNGKGGLPMNDNDDLLGEFTCFAVRQPTNTATTTTTNTTTNNTDNHIGKGIGAALVRAAEHHARSQGCSRMQIGILCLADHEPAYKQWLQQYYLKLGYDYTSTIYLRFRKDDEGNVVEDELHDMYDPLHQLVPCKGILMEKIL